MGFGVTETAVIGDIIARLDVSSLCRSLSRALGNGRATRRIVRVPVHNLRASHHHTPLDAFLRIGRALADNPPGISDRARFYTGLGADSPTSDLPFANYEFGRASPLVCARN